VHLFVNNEKNILANEHTLVFLEKLWVALKTVSYFFAVFLFKLSLSLNTIFSNSTNTAVTFAMMISDVTN